MKAGRGGRAQVHHVQWNSVKGLINSVCVCVPTRESLVEVESAMRLTGGHSQPVLNDKQMLWRSHSV